MYNNGYGVQGGDNWSDVCSKFDAFAGDTGVLVIRLTMGVYVDYLKPAGSGAEAQTMCTLLSSPGTWFWHSTLDSAVATADATVATAAGPWKARVGNHNALVGSASALL
jgi:hypothetical protein